MSTRSGRSIVEYFAEKDGSRCGYCKSSDTNCSNGMWAHKLSVEDYQGLIDRGWRRSGCYCYKPIMDVTCCPAYTIRCAALEFSLSKSQKKIVKRFNRYIISGEKKELHGSSEETTSSEDIKLQAGDSSAIEEWSKQAKAKERACSSASFDASVLEVKESDAGTSEITGVGDQGVESTSVIKQKVSRKADDPNPSAPQQKKAKLLRKERKRMKLLNKGYTEEEADAKLTPKVPQGKSLEEFINEIESPSPAHTLEIRLVQSSPRSRDFEKTLQEAYEVYRKYQMTVHEDPPEKCSLRQYTRFLVNSPLQIKLIGTDTPEFLRSLEESCLLFKKYQIEIHNDPADEDFQGSFSAFLRQTPIEPWKPQNGPRDGYGSFHQQYWLDGKLIAVGVIDILPRCLSSVYFYYDPDFAFLSLGTYGSLREIAMVRSLNKQAPSIEFYYMGYYIHSCPKMQYKANYKPSYLLCPEAYTWHPIEECKPKLDQKKYCRLNPDLAAADVHGNVNVDEVTVLYKCAPMLYGHYKNLNKHRPDNEEQEVLHYAKLVGQQRSRSILLYRADA